MWYQIMSPWIPARWTVMTILLLSCHCFEGVAGQNTKYLNIEDSVCSSGEYSYTEQDRFGVIDFPSDRDFFSARTCRLTIRMNPPQFQGELLHFTPTRFQLGTGDSFKVTYANGNERTFFKGESLVLPPDSAPISFLFSSDSIDSGTGFRIKWEMKEPTTANVIWSGEQVDRQTLAGSSYFHMRSPNYPDRYPNNEHLYWVYEAPIGERLQFEFFHFETDLVDELKFYEGTTVSNTRLFATYSGENKPNTLDSSQNVVIVDFQTDATLRRSGFDVKVSLHSASSTSNTGQDASLTSTKSNSAVTFGIGNEPSEGYAHTAHHSIIIVVISSIHLFRSLLFILATPLGR